MMGRGGISSFYVLLLHSGCLTLTVLGGSFHIHVWTEECFSVAHLKSQLQGFYHESWILVNKGSVLLNVLWKFSRDP